MTIVLEKLDDIETLNVILKRFQDSAFPGDIQIITYTSNATPDTETSASHSLERVPSGYIVCYQDKAGILYDSGTSWTPGTVYFKCSVASVTFKILLF